MNAASSSASGCVSRPVNCEGSCDERGFLRVASDRTQNARLDGEFEHFSNLSIFTGQSRPDSTTTVRPEKSGSLSILW
jgi:hypothetical protein